MPSIFTRSRLEPEENPEESFPVFEQVKQHRQENIIPPIGIADPAVIEAFTENIENEDKIRNAVQEYEDYKKESGIKTFGREAGAHGIRAAEGYLGGINSFLNFLFSGQDLEIEGEKGETLRYRPSENILPNTEELHEMTKEQTGSFYEPKNEFTKASQETSGDIGALMTVPGGGSTWMKILAAITGQVGKQVVKASGGSEKAQDLTKNALLAFTTMARVGNAPQVAIRALNDAENLIPKGLSFSAKPTQEAIKKIKNRSWFKSGSTPSKNPAIAEIERIEGKIVNGKIDAHTAMQIRRDISEARKGLGGYNVNIPDKKAALAYLNEVDQALIASMENYGKNVNPKWFKQYMKANEAYRITQRSRALSEFIERKAPRFKSETAKVLLHGAAVGAAAKLPVLGALAIPGMATVKAIQVGNRMIRSSVLRNHYIDVLRAAATENSAVLEKSLQAFDRAALAEEKKNSSNTRNPR